jgi:hypothetical protein
MSPNFSEVNVLSEEISVNTVLPSLPLTSSRFIVPLILKIHRLGQFARIGEMRNAYKILIRKPEGKTPVGKT